MKFSEKITIIIGIALVATFVIGLAWSISTGLAGFWRGLPFWFIVIFCLYLLILDSLRAIKKWKFTPALYKGEPQAVKVNQIIRFTLS